MIAGCEAGPGRLRLWRWLLVAWVVVQAAIAWVPFRFDPPRPVDNGVARTAEGTLTFSGPRNVATAPAPNWLYEALGDGQLVLDLTVRSEESDQFGPARIFGLSQDFFSANLMVGQEGADLVVRVRRGRDRSGEPHLRVPGLFADAAWYAVQVWVRPEAVRVRVDGVTEVEHVLEAPAFAAWDFSYGVTLGDEHIGGRPWRGEVSVARLRVGDLDVDYVEESELETPARVWYVPGRLREPALFRDGAAWRRAVLHLVAFVPLGALLVLSDARLRGPVWVAGVTALLSLGLQAGKVVVEARHPSVPAVAMQILGAIMGAALVHLWWQICCTVPTEGEGSP